jgi:FtsP/CotA-like multicopper oxidase with cupredoxin domain
MNSKWTFVAIAAILLATAMFMQVYYTEAATTRYFTLYGSASSGWGFTDTSISRPGPTITVEQGDTVNLTLISQDSLPHQFFVSYTNASSPGSGDPESALFNSKTSFQFVATNTTGTYTYRCAVHPGVMYGYFKVVPTGGDPRIPTAGNAESPSPKHWYHCIGPQKNTTALIKQFSPRPAGRLIRLPRK